MNHLRALMPFLTGCLLAVFTASPLAAQEKSAKPPFTASLVPIGANSDAYWEGGGPGMRAIALDPDAAPPATLCVRTKKGFGTIPGVLNRPSIALPVSGGILRVFANPDGSEDKDPPLFGDFKIPQTPGHYDVFLTRAKETKGWDKPDSLVLPSNQTDFPPDSFRLVNLCDQPIKAKIASTSVTLGPRSVKIVPTPVKGAMTLISVQAVHANGDELRFIIRTGIRLEMGQRANLVFYPGRDPQKPCLATWFHQAEPDSGEMTEKAAAD